MMGQAAGTAAGMAIAAGAKVRDVDVKRVRRELTQQGAVLQTDLVPALLASAT